MLFGVQILPGVEANITSHEGELDIPLRYLKQMSIVLCGLHVICYPGGNSEQNTQAYLKAMSNPYIDIMVHPGRPEFEMDLEKVAYTSAQLEVPVEINNSSLGPEKGGAWSNCHYFASNAAKYGGPIVLGSDAHFWDRVGGLDLAVELALEAGISDEQILNYSPKRILYYLEQRRKQRTKLPELN
jgi:putative hydrolase